MLLNLGMFLRDTPVLRGVIRVVQYNPQIRLLILGIHTHTRPVPCPTAIAGGCAHHNHYLVLGGFTNIVSTDGASGTGGEPGGNTPTMKMMMAVAELNPMGMNVLLANGTILGRIGNRRIDQCLLDLLRCGHHWHGFIPIHGDLKGHANILLRRLGMNGQGLQKLLHGLPHFNLVVDQTESSLTFLLTQNHTELGFVCLDDLTKKLNLLHCLQVFPSS